jgi:hypothetical protein
MKQAISINDMDLRNELRQVPDANMEDVQMSASRIGAGERSK